MYFIFGWEEGGLGVSTFLRSFPQPSREIRIIIHAFAIQVKTPHKEYIRKGCFTFGTERSVWMTQQLTSQSRSCITRRFIALEFMPNQVKLERVSKAREI